MVARAGREGMGLLKQVGRGWGVGGPIAVISVACSLILI